LGVVAELGGIIGYITCGCVPVRVFRNATWNVGAPPATRPF
jgi:hypothetical protein